MLGGMFVSCSHIFITFCLLSWNVRMGWNPVDKKEEG